MQREEAFILGTGAMAWWLRACAVVEDLGCVSSTHIASSRGFYDLFFPPWVLYAYGKHIHTCRETLYV